jgi:anti-sigma factor RsiW
MRCEEVQEYLADRLAGSLSDRLSETVHAYVRTHMLSCPECCEELEHFEEMQKVLQTIPVEPCDSNAMRSRFHLLMGAEDTESLRITATGSSPMIRPLKVALVSFAALVAVIAAFAGARQALKWIPAARVVPPLSTPAAAPSPKPVSAAVRTGAVSGQVRASNGEVLRKVRVAVEAVSKSGMPSTEIAVETSTDGKYRLDNIPTGQYYVLARMVDATTTYYPGSPDAAGATIVSIQPGAVLEGVDFPFIVSAGNPKPPAVPSVMAEVTGRVLQEDGSEVSDAMPLGGIAITATGKSNGAVATTMKIDGNGTFDRTIAPDEYRFRIAEFSQNYLIRSMTAGGIDLLKESLKLSGSSPVAMEIRVARRNNNGAGKVLGRVLDGVTNAPSQADRVVLCCFESGAAERISTPLRSDGTFEFDGVPSGSYTAELRGSENLVIVNPAFNATAAGVSGLKLFSASQVVDVDVSLTLDTGERLPYKPDTSIVFTATTGAFRVAASCFVGNLFRASVPSSESYILSVSNLAPGYAVQSIVNTSTDLMHGGLFTATARPTFPPRIVITLTKN